MDIKGARGAKRIEHLGLYAALAVLVGIGVAINAASGINFFKTSNLLNIARGFSMLAIASLGQTVVIIGGGLDLSIGETISTANVFAAAFMAGSDAMLMPVAFLACAFGAAVGLSNGLLVAKRGVPPFIATLGLATVVRGIRLVWTQGMPNGRIPPALVEIGVGSTLGTPNLVFVFALVVVLFALLLGRTGYGRRLYAVGTNKAVATLSGLRSGGILIGSYVICGVFAAFVGLLLGGYTGMSDQFVGEGYDIDTIAASVLGGASIGGGVGSVGGTLLGAVMMLVVTNIAVLARFPIQSQMLMKGLLIVVALWIDSRKKL
jgi:ribose/xylose/arabinose/galactoside ABC-type transport system permease subunit